MKHYKEEHLLSTLHSFRGLKHGWEGYGVAVPIEEKSIQNTEKLIPFLTPHFTLEVFPLTYGAVQLENSGEEFDFEIEVHPDYYEITLFAYGAHMVILKEIGNEQGVLDFLLGTF